MEGEPQPGSSHQPRTIEATDTFLGNPYVHFAISEGWAGLTSITVYLFFRFGAFATDWITKQLPLHDTRPAEFLELVLSWGAAFSASATFLVISIYQILVLMKRLTRSWGHE
jgi:hypothetical protein